MEDILRRVWDNLAARVTGPMSFRLIMQPLVASGFAIWSGVKDARAGRPAFLWTTITDPAQRSLLLREAWKDVGKVFILAAVLDAIYQLIVHRGVYILEMLIVAAVLAALPYVLIRGPVTRLVRLLSHSQNKHPQGEQHVK
jgi:hypothetical protein